MILYKGAGYTVKLDDERGAIISLLKGNKEFVCRESILPLFAIRLRGEKGEKTYIDAYEASKQNTTKNGDTYRMEFSGFKKVDLQILVTVTFAEQISWNISIKNNSNLCIEWVDFPQIAVPDDLKGSGGNSEIFWGFNEGVVVDDIKYREQSWFAYDAPE